MTATRRLRAPGDAGLPGRGHHRRGAGRADGARLPGTARRAARRRPGRAGRGQREALGCRPGAGREPGADQCRRASARRRSSAARRSRSTWRTTPPRTRRCACWPSCGGPGRGWARCCRRTCTGRWTTACAGRAGFAGAAVQGRLRRAGRRWRSPTQHEVDLNYVRCAERAARRRGLPDVRDARPAAGARSSTSGRAGTTASRAASSTRCCTGSGRTSSAGCALGHTVRVYVPYGEQWYGYLMRRLAERPANMAFFLRALVRPSR